MQLSKQDRQTLARARELVAEVDAASERHYPSLVARLKLAAGDLANIIEQAPDDSDKWASAAIQRLLDDGYQITTYRQMNDGLYHVILTGPMGSTSSGITPDLYEALSHAVIAAGIDL
jgi:hypothetical protein